MRRGRLCRLEARWFVVVSTDSVNRLLPTCWAVVATLDRGPLVPPLVQSLEAGAAGDHPELWIRTTQIRTVALSDLIAVGWLPAADMAALDQVVGRLCGLQLASGREA